MKRLKSVAGFFAVVFSIAVISDGADAQCVLPYQLTNGQVADAPQMMANFNALVTCLGLGGSTNSIQYNAGSGILAGLGPLTDGQLAVGSTGAAPQAQTLTAGANVSIAGGPGNITIASTNSTSVGGLYGQVMSATPTAASTGLGVWLNQGTAVTADGPVGMSIDAPPIAGTATNLVGRYGGAPTPPYKIKALIGATRSSNYYSAVGLGWYDGSSKIHVMDMVTAAGGANVIEVTQWNSVTSYNSTPFVTSPNKYQQPIWLQIEDNGTNITFAFSQDGANFLPLYSTAKSSGFLGAAGYSHVFFFVHPQGTTHTIGSILSWTQY